MKRVLMISYFFPPMGDGGVFRNLKLARYLPEHGWSPHVLCGRAEDYWVRDESLLDQLPPDLAVTRIGGLTGQSVLRRLRSGFRAGDGSRSSAATGKEAGAGSRSSGLFRHLRTLGDFLCLPDSYSGWISPAVREGRKILAANDVDLIYSSSPPDSSHLAAARLARETGLPWVADFRDPWINLHLKRSPTALHRSWHLRKEMMVLQEARIVAVTEGWRRYYAERTSAPPRLIRNGFDPADFTGLPEAATAGAGEKIIMLHAGKLSLTRSVAPMLNGVARLLGERPDLRDRFEIHLLGPRESDNERIARELGLSNIVKWIDSVDHAGSVARQRQADLLLLIKHDDSRYRDLIPGKFYEYVAADRPILAITPEGEIDTLMEQYRLGWTARPSEESVARGLATALDALSQGIEPRGGTVEELTRPYQTGQMAALFDDLLEERSNEQA
ncbi:MAG: glycosyltransferase family 4 protein [bacterium]|nr:glycosyltransferase family 4 protein [bacterium]